MEPRYELHVDGQVFKGPLWRLKHMIDNTYLPYELYAYYRSKSRATCGNQKMNIEDMRDAKRLKDKGYDCETIARKFGVTKDQIWKVIRDIGKQTLNTHT